MPKLIKLIKMKRDREYYGGLALLIASCLALAWALLRDSFKAPVFLGGFLLFASGYILLWRSDFKLELAGLKTEVADLRAQLAVLTTSTPAGESAGDEAAPEEPEFLPTEF